MKLTDDDYRQLAEQCATQGWGRIDRDGEMVYVSMYTHVEYDQHELSLTGGHIPVYAEVYVTNVFCDEDTEVDTARIEELTYDILMQY